MSNKTVIRISLTGFIAIVCMAFFLPAFNAATPSPAKTCKESMDECCKKQGAETRSEIDFETLSGKFFSSASY